MSATSLHLSASDDYTSEEREMIVRYLFSLTKAEIEPFFRDNGIPHSGTKEEQRSRLQDYLNNGTISYASLVSHLDKFEPWGAQHVYLFNGPTRGISLETYKDPTHFRSYLQKHKLAGYLNNKIPLILPEHLSLSSIEHSAERLRITAIERRISFERETNLDSEEKDSGDKIEYRAFRRIVTRGLIAFEWKFLSNVAMMQISQLPSHSTYENAQQKFYYLIQRWMDLNIFSELDLTPCISNLHKIELDRTGEIRSHGIEYVTGSGRRLGGKSASSKSPLLGGESVIDSALNNIRQEGVGHSGNFYFLPKQGSPLSSAVHVIILAGQSRINFPTGNSEEAFRYVVQKIRSACRRTP